MATIKEPSTIKPQEPVKADGVQPNPTFTRKAGVTKHKPGCGNIKGCKC